MYQEHSRGIDYLTVRIPRSSIVWSRIFSLEEWEIYRIVWYPFAVIWSHDCVNSKVFRTLRIIDLENNRLWQIKIVKEKWNQCIYDELELQGAYWMGYSHYISLPEFLAIWDVDIYNSHGLSRVDYRFDLYVDSQKIWYDHFSGSERPVKKLQKNKVTTWMNSQSERVVLVAYDKKLDIFDNLSKKNFVNEYGWNPYDEYVESERDITRVEYRKNSRALRESSRTIIEELAYIENDAIKYMNENFGIECEKKFITKYSRTENTKLLEQKAHEKTKRALQMIEAYTKTLDTYGKHGKLVQFLHDRYWSDIIRELQDLYFEKIVWI